MRRLICLSVAVLMFWSFGLLLTADDNECRLSEEAQGYCVEIGEMYGICPELLMSIAEHESGGNPKAENGSCKCLMQVSTKWHADRMEKLGVTDIYDEYGNILLGADYISELREDYTDVAIMLMVYNGDSNARKAMNGECDISKYAMSVLARSAQLERRNNK